VNADRYNDYDKYKILHANYSTAPQSGYSDPRARLRVNRPVRECEVQTLRPMWMDTIPEQGMGASYGATPAIFEAGNYDYVGLQVADCDEPTHQQSADLAMLSMPDLIPRPEAITASLECSAPRKYEIFTHAQADRVYLRPELTELLAPPIGFVDPEKPESVAPPVTNMYGRSVASQQFYKRPVKPTISNRYVTDADIAFQPVPTDAFPQPAPDVAKVPAKVDASTNTDTDKAVEKTITPTKAGVGSVPAAKPVAVPPKTNTCTSSSVPILGANVGTDVYDKFIAEHYNHPIMVQYLPNKNDRLVYLGWMYQWGHDNPELESIESFVSASEEIKNVAADSLAKVLAEGWTEESFYFAAGQKVREDVTS
jgi:hypothetical protein